MFKSGNALLIDKKNVIFDLDGTLINSATSILNCLKFALDKCAITPQVPLNSKLIGPPLMQTLMKLTGTSNIEILNAVADVFKSNYDGGGYSSCTFWAGIPKILNELNQKKHSLFLATNKRMTPTLKILYYLNWEEFFKAIYTLDKFSPPLMSKTELLARLIYENALDINDTVYIGDRHDDKVAAELNKIHFILVN